MLPDISISRLVNNLGLTLKDAKILVAIDDGARLDYFDEILDALNCAAKNSEDILQERQYAKIVANWFVHSKIHKEALMLSFTESQKGSSMSSVAFSAHPNSPFRKTKHQQQRWLPLWRIWWHVVSLVDQPSSC